MTDKMRINMLKKDIESYKEDNKRLVKELDVLQERFNYLFNSTRELDLDIIYLEDKIDKTIEYINKHNKIHNEQYGYNSLFCDELLEILGDKENE